MRATLVINLGVGRTREWKKQGGPCQGGSLCVRVLGERDGAGVVAHDGERVRERLADLVELLVEVDRFRRGVAELHVLRVARGLGSEDRGDLEVPEGHLKWPKAVLMY